MLELACLYGEVHRRFYQTSVEKYCVAMGEVTKMAWALGYTVNDLAKVATHA